MKTSRHKKLVLLTFVLVFAFNAFANSTYEDGWRAGWIEGWHHVQGGSAFVPFIPSAPFPQFDQTDYQSGYDEGFLAGIKAAQGQ